MLTLRAMRTATTTALLTLAGLLAGCQGPDVGQPCTIAFLDTSTVPVDYVQFGSTECEDTLTCVRSPLPAGSKIKSVLAGCQPDGTGCGYCSKPCVSNSDCYQSSTGLECRSVVLDPSFLNSLDPTVRQQFLGDSTLSNYCAAPLPSP